MRTHLLVAARVAALPAPASAQNSLRRTDARMYEVACHEGNYGLANILSGARAEERR
jgi:hypothetical protein